MYPAGNQDALCKALRDTLQPGRAPVMGASSCELVAQWSYDEDVEGLRAALRHVTRKNLLMPIPGKA